jgi:DNA polymerase (family X)
MDRLAIARLLREIGLLLEIQGGNRFKARAYERGARALEALAIDLDPLLAQDRLTDIPAIGPALASTIRELHRTGQSKQLERLRAALPPGVLELSQVPGLSVPRIAALHQALGITSLEDLRAAMEAGRVRRVRGFGPKTEAKLLAGLRQLEAHGEQTLLHRAMAEGDRLLTHVRSTAAVVQAELAGALRRRVETVDRLVVAVSSGEPARALDHVARYPPAFAPLTRTASRLTFRIASGQLVETETAAPSAFPGLLHALTGSEAHRARLGERARERGLVLDHMGLVRANDGRRQPIETEADLYRHLGLPYLPPEVREEGIDLDTAAARCAAGGLVQESDIQGMVHCHTVYSDGADTIEVMARAAQAMGMSYITITDHSPTASYAGGLSLDRLRRQWDEIAKVQETVKGLTILRGTESDILADGRLDYPDEVLEQLDIVIASIHNRHRMDEAQMTSRPGPGDAPTRLQSLGPRPRALCPPPVAHCLPDGGGARRRRGVTGGDRGEREPASSRHGAALAVRSRPPRASFRRVDRRALHRRAQAPPLWNRHGTPRRPDGTGRVEYVAGRCISGSRQTRRELTVVHPGWPGIPSAPLSGLRTWPLRLRTCPTSP